MRGLACPLLLLVAGFGVRAAEPPTVTVCQLYDQRQSPLVDEVQFQARALMGPRHGAIFMDPHCPPGTAIPFRFIDHLPPNSQAVLFDHALTGDVMDLSLRSFDAEVTGTYAPATAINPRGLFTVISVAWFRKSPQQTP